LADALVLQIRAYFDSGRNDFSLPFDWNNATLFQRRVWEAVRRVPFGETRTYGEIAVECGHPGAARAVGTVMKSNPVALLVPCHRVVAMNGLGGYFGPGGLALKRRLLDHEAPDRPGDLRAKNSSGPCH
jgi:O-6-methylguanine DNA methyltransferase